MPRILFPNGISIQLLICFMCKFQNYANIILNNAAIEYSLNFCCIPHLTRH